MFKDTIYEIENGLIELTQRYVLFVSGKGKD